MNTTAISSPFSYRIPSSSLSSRSSSSSSRPTTPNAARPLRSSPLVSPPSNEKTRTGATPSRISVAALAPSRTPSPSRDQDHNSGDGTGNLSARDYLSAGGAGSNKPHRSRAGLTLPRPVSESFAFQMDLRQPPRIVAWAGGDGVVGGNEIGMGTGMGIGIGMGVGTGLGTGERGAFTAPGIYSPPPLNSMSTPGTSPSTRLRRPRTAPERDSFSAPAVFVPSIPSASDPSLSLSGTLPSLSETDTSAHTHFPFSQFDSAPAYAQIPVAMMKGGRQRAASAVDLHSPLPSPPVTSPIPPTSAQLSSRTSSNPSRNWLTATSTGPPPFSRTRLGAGVVMPVKKGNGGQGTRKDKIKRPKTAPERNEKEKDMGTETKLRTRNEEGKCSGGGLGRCRRRSMLVIGELGELREEDGEQIEGLGYDEVLHHLSPNTDGSIRSTSTTATLLSPSLSLADSTPPLSRDNSSNTISTSGESIRTLFDHEGIADELKKLEPVYRGGIHQHLGAGDIFAMEKQLQLQTEGPKPRSGSHLKGVHSYSANATTAAPEFGDKLYTNERRTNINKWKAFLKMVGIKLPGRKGQAVVAL